ncbi:hypothetical protein OJ996_20430 [Luteolibacter sp. GHJ8]|uniref:Uncharacterized protein n=1 Tax=Luteolibacter rhizosphaerae TaxID=2989719 RepID=A0ABT3G7Y9_9BACT|nr:hypothetical protein [Luteolibacter rhizosphaerae]MCW1915966.1 hypothetical protein [Luteolibacter rhizosphaerae]
MKPPTDPGPPRQPSSGAAIAILGALVIVVIIAIAIIKGSRPSADNPPNGMPQNIRGSP